MEDTLRETQSLQSLALKRLNPCFNGRYSQREFEGDTDKAIEKS